MIFLSNDVYKHFMIKLFIIKILLNVTLYKKYYFCKKKNKWNKEEYYSV